MEGGEVVRQAEYQRHKHYFQQVFNRRMNALREMYPEEWKKDHAPKGGPAESKGSPRSGHRVGAKL